MKKEEEIKHHSAGKLIGQLARAAHVYFQHEFKKYAIGHAQMRTLFYIAHHEGLTQVELTNHLELDKSSVTSQLKILEGNGYIQRYTSEMDARMQQITITEKTKEILPSLKKVLFSWTEALLNGFNETEREEIFMYLGRMNTNAKKKLEEIKKHN